MAQSDNSAERELLKAIEGKFDLPEAPKKAEPAPSTRATGKPVQFLLDSAKFISELIKKKPGEIKIFTPESINVFLIGLLAVLFLSYFVNTSLGLLRLNRLPKFETPKLKITKRDIVLPLRDYQYYFDKILGRNIFTQYTEKKTVESTSGPKIEDLVKDLKLVGISWADQTNDRFVMIEDTQAKLTYFLREGEAVSKTNTIVKEIEKNSVVLSYMKQEIELR